MDEFPKDLEWSKEVIKQYGDELGENSKLEGFIGILYEKKKKFFCLVKL